MKWDYEKTLAEDFARFEVDILEIDRFMEAEAQAAEDLMADLDSGLPLIESSDDLVNEDLPLPPEIIKGFLHQGLKGVLGSSSKARKTWILLHLGIALSEGLEFWGKETVKGKVLYINFEIPRAFMRSRISTLRKCLGLASTPLFHVWNLRGKAAPLWTLLEDFIRRVKREQYSLVVIDPIYKSLGERVENAAEDVAQICNEMERIAVETGCAVVYAAHFSKGNQASKEAIDRISGSGVWARDADSLMIMTKHEAEDCYTVETILRNLPEQPPFVVRWQYPIMQIDEELNPDKLKKAAGGKQKEHDPIKLLSFIKETTQETAISSTEWAKRANIARTTLSDYFEEMRYKGWIATSGDGTNARKFITDLGRKLLDGN